MQRLSIVLLLAALSFPSCAKPPVTLSPAGVSAFQATRVVKALDVLRDFAIDAEAQSPKLLSTAHTRAVVTVHASALRTIAAVPNGWRPTVLAALQQLQRDLPAAAWSRLVPYVTLIQTLIASLP